MNLNQLKKQKTRKVTLHGSHASKVISVIQTDCGEWKYKDLLFYPNGVLKSPISISFDAHKISDKEENSRVCQVVLSAPIAAYDLGLFIPDVSKVITVVRNKHGNWTYLKLVFDRNGKCLAGFPKACQKKLGWFAPTIFFSHPKLDNFT